MQLGDKELTFLADHKSAAMITVGADGYAKAARVGVVLIDGKLWSSSTADRARTKRLRRDPRSTLFVFDAAFAFLALEATVTVLEGPQALADSVRLFREMQGKPAGPLSWFGAELEEPEFLDLLAKEGRLIYEFDVTRAYGLY